MIIRKHTNALVKLLQVKEIIKLQDICYIIHYIFVTFSRCVCEETVVKKIQQADFTGDLEASTAGVGVTDLSAYIRFIYKQLKRASFDFS